MKKDTPRLAFDAAFPGLLWANQNMANQMAATAYARKAIEIDALPDQGPGGLREVRHVSGHGLYLNQPQHDRVWEGIDFIADPHAPADWNGVRIEAECSNLTFRECRFIGFDTAVNHVPLNGKRLTNIRYERCMMLDSQSGQGAYGWGTDGWHFIQCVSDRAGWPIGQPEKRTMWCHQWYIDNGNTGVEIVESWGANPASYGTQLRCGGSARDVIYLRCPHGLRLGGGGDSHPQEAGGVMVDVENVAILGRAYPDAVPLEGLLTLSNIKGGSIKRLLIAGPYDASKWGWAIVGVGGAPVTWDADIVGWAGKEASAVMGGPVAGIRLKSGGVDLTSFDAALQAARERPMGQWTEFDSPKHWIAIARSLAGLT